MNNINPGSREATRLALLHFLQLGSALEGERNIADLDVIARLAAGALRAPLASIQVIDSTEVRTLAGHGVLPQRVTPREGSVCAQAVLQDGPLTVYDASLDGRFSGHTLVQDEPRVRAVAAMALRLHGLPLATLCVFDRRPRDFDADQIDALCDLTSLAERWLHERHTAAEARHQRTGASAFVLRLGEVLRPQLDMLTGHAQMLMLDGGEKLSPTTLRHLEQVHRAAQRVCKLLDDLRRLVHAERAEFSNTRAIDLDVLVRHAMALHEAQAQREGVRLVHVPSDAPVRAAGDLSAVMQIIGELLSNGIRYNLRDASLTLQTSVRNGRALLSFADQGLGLDAKQLVRLFEPFERLHVARGDDVEHTGLGLVIARALATAMGGDVRADCRAGGGCVFSLELPLHLAERRD